MALHRIEIDPEMFALTEAREIAHMLELHDIVLPIVKLLCFFDSRRPIPLRVKAQAIDDAVGIANFANTLLLFGWLDRQRGFVTPAGVLRHNLDAMRARVNGRLRKQLERNGEFSHKEKCDGPALPPTPPNPPVISTSSELIQSVPAQEQEQIRSGAGVSQGQYELSMPEPPESMTVVRDSKNFMLPIWVPLDAWEAWIEMRTKMRKPITDYAKQLALKKLDEMHKHGTDVRMVLEQSILNGWQGIFEARRTRDRDRPPPQGLADYSGVNYGATDEKISWLNDEDL